MMEMKQGKRIHTVALRLDDQSFLSLSHLAMYERKELASYIHDLLIENLYGLTSKLRVADDGVDSNRSDSE